MTEQTILEEYKSQRKDDQVMARVPAQLKEDAQKKCDQLKIPLSFIIERALKEWVDTTATD